MYVVELQDGKKENGKLLCVTRDPATLAKPSTGAKEKEMVILLATEHGAGIKKEILNVQQILRQVHPTIILYIYIYIYNCLHFTNTFHKLSSLLFRWLD